MIDRHTFGKIGRASVVAITLALSACATGGSAPATYDLSAAREFSSGGRSSAHMVVMEPRAISALSNERIMVREDAARVSYYPDSQWTDQLPRLVQARLTQAFENSNRFRAIGQNGDGLKADFILVTEVRRFEYSPTEGAVVSLYVKLVNDRNGRVRAARLFEATDQGSGDEVKAVVNALDRAFTEVQRDIVAFAVRRI